MERANGGMATEVGIERTMNGKTKRGGNISAKGVNIHPKVSDDVGIAV